MSIDEIAQTHRWLILFLWLITTIIGLYIIVWWDDR